MKIKKYHSHSIFNIEHEQVSFFPENSVFFVEKKYFIEVIIRLQILYAVYIVNGYTEYNPRLEPSS